jgi:hypothetical protein
MPLMNAHVQLYVACHLAVVRVVLLDQISDVMRLTLLQKKTSHHASAKLCAAEKRTAFAVLTGTCTGRSAARSTMSSKSSIVLVVGFPGSSGCGLVLLGGLSGTATLGFTQRPAWQAHRHKSRVTRRYGRLAVRTLVKLLTRVFRDSQTHSSAGCGTFFPGRVFFLTTCLLTYTKMEPSLRMNGNSVHVGGR